MKDALGYLMNAITKNPQVVEEFLAALVGNGELSADGKIIVKLNLEMLVRSFEKYKKVLDRADKGRKISDKFSRMEFHTRLGIIGKYVQLDTFLRKLADLFYTGEYDMAETISTLLFLTYDMLHGGMGFEEIKWSSPFVTKAESIRQILLEEEKRDAAAAQVRETGDDEPEILRF